MRQIERAPTGGNRQEPRTTRSTNPILAGLPAIEKGYRGLAEAIRVRVGLLAESSDIELLRTGFAWWLERYLQNLKALWFINEAALDHPGQIRGATLLLDSIQNWPSRDLARFLGRYRKVASNFIAECIEEAKTAQFDLADAILFDSQFFSTEKGCGMSGCRVHSVNSTREDGYESF